MGKLYIDDNGEIFCNGTFGDAYMMCLKIYGNQDKINKINFHTYNQDFIPTIKNIISLLGDIPFEYINYETLDKHKRCVGFIDKDEEGTPFPEWELPNISKFSLPESYQVIQLQSGASIERTPWKCIDYNVVNHLKNIPIVLVGTDNQDIKFLKRSVIDLRNKTSILECFNIVKSSQEFFGNQGLLAFFALSQKVNTTIYLKHFSDTNAVNCRIERIPEWKNYVKYVK